MSYWLIVIFFSDELISEIRNDIRQADILLNDQDILQYSKALCDHFNNS